MGLSAFDPEIHHIGLGPEDLDEPYGFLTLPGYQRSGQNYGAPTDFGGEKDLVGSPNLSRWTQDDFTGGQYQPNWGVDPAQFAYSENVLPSQFANSLRTCPPLFPHRFEAMGGEVPVLMFGYGQRLYTVFQRKVIAHNLSTGARDVYTISSTNALDGLPMGTAVSRAAAFDRAGKVLYIQVDGGFFFGFQIPTMSFIGASVPGGGATGSANGCFISAGTLLGAWRGALYVAQLKDDGSMPQSGDYTRQGRLPAAWKDACSLNGLCYILCGDSDLNASLVSWSPAAGILPVTDFPFNFVAESCESYGGRVYVGGSGRDISDNHRYAELYEVMAGSLRLVRTFAPESFSTQRSPRSINDFCVWEGLLFFGDNGRGLVAYDLQKDAFHGGPTLQPPDGQRRILKLVEHRERLYAWVNHPLDIDGQSGLYRVANAPNEVIGSYQGRVVTSDFGPELDRDKRWAVCKVLTRYGPAKLGYSIVSGLPGGDSFDDVPGTTEQHGELYLTTFDLRHLPISSQIRFRYSLPRGIDVSSFTELIASTVAFTFLENGKWSWTFTVNGSYRVEGRDLVGHFQNIHDIGTELRRYWRDRVPLTFRDLDGQSYKVQITNFTESRPNITPPRRFYGGDGTSEEGDEALYHLTLLEL